MSQSITERFKYREKVKPDDERYGKLRAEFPQLSEALIGWFQDDGKSVQPGGTLMIFIDDGTLKWTFHHRSSRTTLFGTFLELSLALEDVEAALSGGRYEFKRG